MTSKQDHDLCIPERTIEKSVIALFWKWEHGVACVAFASTIAMGISGVSTRNVSKRSAFIELYIEDDVVVESGKESCCICCIRVKCRVDGLFYSNRFSLYVSLGLLNASLS